MRSTYASLKKKKKNEHNDNLLMLNTLCEVWSVEALKF